MRATVSSKGQVTIPKPLRDQLGIRSGTVIDFEPSRDGLFVKRVAVEDPVAAVYGLLADEGVRTDDLLSKLRGDDAP